MKKSLATIAVITLLTSLANAQQIRLSPGDVDVKSIDSEIQKTPEFSGGGSVKSKNIPYPREWLEVEVEFEVDGDSDTVIPELMFRYYIAISDKQGGTRVLTGDVKHINVLAGDESYSAVYVSPARLGEITGDFRRFPQANLKAVGVEIFYNGVIVGLDSTMSGSTAQFWKSPSISVEPGVLGKADTPFALLWLDRYADSVPSGQ
ncbi:MAG: Amuc_1102 family pilus-like protein [Verrucomicrobiota bacterium]